MIYNFEDLSWKPLSIWWSLGINLLNTLLTMSGCCQLSIIHLPWCRMLEFMLDMSVACLPWIVVSNIDILYYMTPFVNFGRSDDYVTVITLKNSMMNPGIQSGRTEWRVGRIRRTRRKRLRLSLKLRQKRRIRFHPSSRWKRNSKCKLYSNKFSTVNR